MRLVDADDLKNFIYSESCDKCEFKQKILDYIDNIPAITKELKHGKWTFKPTGNYDGYIVCSACGLHIPSYKLFERDEYTGTSKYCPFCGARMDGE